MSTGGSGDADRWTGAVGTTFRIAQADAPIELRLAEVSDVRERDGQETYSLVFESAEPLALDQATYTLTGDDGARREVFLVPIAEARFEAVFNRLVREDAR